MEKSIQEIKVVNISFPLISIHGGAAHTVLTLSRELKYLGIEIRNFALGYNRNCKIESAEITNPFFARKLNKYSMIEPKEILRFYKELSKFNPNIIILNQVFNLGNLLILLYSLLNSTKIIAFPHGSLKKNAKNKNNFRKSIFYFLIYKRLLKISEVILVNSLAEENTVPERFREKVAHFRLGAYEPSFQLTQKKRNYDFVYLGRFDENKRLDLLIDSLNYIKENNTNFKSLIVGAGSAEAFGILRMRIETLNLNDKIELKGWMNRQEVSLALLDSKCLVVPSDFESYGLVVSEALLHGCRCVISPHIPFEFENSSRPRIFRLESQDPKKYAIAMERALIEWNVISKNEFELYVQEFSWKTSAKNLLAILLDLSW